MQIRWLLKKNISIISKIAILVVVCGVFLWLGLYPVQESVRENTLKRPSYHVRRIPYGDRNGTREEGVIGKPGGKPPSDHVQEIQHMKRRFPGAFLLGAGKCGTGALRRFLRRHPQIVMHDQEEMWFYDSAFHMGEHWHLQQMPPSTPDQVTMETSPGYFHSEEAMQRILNANSNGRFVVILRDPVHRAISQFVHMFAEGPFIKNGFNAKPTAENFKTMAMRNDGSVRDNWEPITYGLYINPLRRWLNDVPREQFYIVDGTEFAKNPLPQLQGLEQFLGVNSFFDKSQFIYNKTRNFFCIKETDGQTSCLPNSKGRKHPYIAEDVLGPLRSFYKPYNEDLYKTLGQRLEWT